MDKNPKSQSIVATIQNFYRAICYLLYDPNSYLTSIENILKYRNPNIQIPRVAAPSPADCEKAQTYIDNGLIFI